MKIDRVHFYTRDAVKTKDWFVCKMGFKAIATRINPHTHTEVIALGSICLVFSSPLSNASPVAKYLKLHPSGVIDVAFKVPNLQSIIERASYLGLDILQNIQTHQSGAGEFQDAKIQGWNSLQHTVIEDNQSNPPYCIPDLNINIHFSNDPSKLQIHDIDHLVLNVAAGKLASAVKLYQALFEFKIQQSFTINTKTSGLYSQALIDHSGKVQFNINEPTSINSQIQEFIDLNCGSGIQHLALRSQNLINDVALMQQKEITFLSIPPSYYLQLDQTLNLNVHEWQAIANEQILVDRDSIHPQSLLMQIFTQPIFEQPTFFLEFIERRNQAQGFGQGNFQELFAAVEREQIKILASHHK